MVLIQAYSTRDRCIAPTLLHFNASSSFAELFSRQEALSPQDHKAACLALGLCGWDDLCWRVSVCP